MRDDIAGVVTSKYELRTGNSIKVWVKVFFFFYGVFISFLFPGTFRVYVTCPHPTMDPSDNDASRSIMLRRQREAALRRRSNQVTQKSDGNGEDGCNSGPSLRRMSSASTIAVEDVMAWEDAKKRERIEARIREEGIRRSGGREYDTN